VSKRDTAPASLAAISGTTPSTIAAVVIRIDPEVEKPCSLEEVFEWFRDCLEQIRRSVIGQDTASEHSARWQRKAKPAIDVLLNAVA